MHMRRLKRLQKAVDTRDDKLDAIAKKLVDLQQVMVNHGTQLCALYGGRREDVASLLPPSSPPSSNGLAATVSQTNKVRIVDPLEVGVEQRSPTLVLPPVTRGILKQPSPEKPQVD